MMSTLSEGAWLLLCVCAGATAGHASLTTTPSLRDGNNEAMEKLPRMEQALYSPHRTRRFPFFLVWYGSHVDLSSFKDALSDLETKLEARLTKLEAKVEALETKLEATETKLEATEMELESTRDFIQSHLKGAGSKRVHTEYKTSNLSQPVNTEWLGIACGNDSDCRAGQNSTCYEARCNCLPGHFYSVSADTCVSSCTKTDLGTGFTWYYKGNIPGSVITSKSGLNERECFDLCTSYPSCRSIDYRTSDRACYPTSDTALEAGWHPVTSGYHDHYQRFCA